MSNDNSERKAYDPIAEADRILVDVLQKKESATLEELSDAIVKAINYLDELNGKVKERDYYPAAVAYAILMKAFYELYEDDEDARQGFGIASEEALGYLGEALE